MRLPDSALARTVFPAGGPQKAWDVTVTLPL